MKKAWFLAVFLILLFNLVIAQEENQEIVSGNELLVRFHSFGKQASIDLKRYLGESEEYYYSASKNVTVTIDQENGIATLIAKPGWEGVETIRFTTSKPASLIKFRENPEERIITDSDIAKIFQELINKTFSNIIGGVELQNVRYIDTKLEGGEIIINLNNEAEIFFGVSGNKPETTLNILIPNAGPPEIKSFEVSKLNPYVIALLSLIFIFIFRKQVKRLLFSKEIEIDLKNRMLIELFNIQKLKDQKEKEERLYHLLNKFFNILDISQKSSPLELNKFLEKRNIKGDLKQQVIYLFSKYSEYKTQDKNEIMKTFRDILGKL